ncbi:type I-E CRISPR-associated protein Cas7/Cse4/CasC [Sedimentitalea sp. HM32M-2]|uniref:type I-E CRISPR-associated protein Cas7/Cse4/CasC n=1 Tax=Sedimentitalea sp. HM32M-2 TaxID=3351566 RepID=UPI00362A8192
MTTFIQFHSLTRYGLSNPNRDDQGRPKQAMIGGSPRLRMSSQSVKRALRESAFFALDLGGNRGIRTKRLHDHLLDRLIAAGQAEATAAEIAEQVAGVFGKLDAPAKGERRRHATTLAFISPEEWAFAEELADKAAAGEALPDKKALTKLILRRADGAVDIAMFGRMLADNADYNREAAVQVAHAFTTHAAQIQEDWYSAVDDLNKKEETGAGHLGETGFGSGIYYQYVCVNADLLIENLAGDKELAAKGGEALTQALALATPRGKQNSFAHHPHTEYLLAEVGPQTPRDLSGAFFAPVHGQPWFETSVEALHKTRADLDAAYGPSCAEHRLMQVGQGGTLADIVAFVGDTIRGL